MKSIFKNKALIALKLVLLLSLSTKGHASETPGIAQGGAAGQVFVTVDGGFTDDDRRVLGGAATAVEVEAMDDKIGSPTDLMVIPRDRTNTVFGVINRLVDGMGAQPAAGPTTIFGLLEVINQAVNPNGGNTITIDLGEVLRRMGLAGDGSAVDSLFGRHRQEIDLLNGIRTALTTRGGMVDLTDVLTRIGDRHGSDLFTEIATISRLVGTSSTDIGDIIRLIGPAPVSLYNTIIDGDTQILTAINRIAGTIGTSDVNIQTLIQNIDIIMKWIGQPAHPDAHPTETIYKLLYVLIEKFGIIKHHGRHSNLGAILGDPSDCHASPDTVFGRLHTIFEEIRGIRVGATPHGFMEFLKENHKAQLQLAQGMTYLIQQLCVGKEDGEKYLPKALVGIKCQLDDISQHLKHPHHAASGSHALPFVDGPRIIEILGEPEDDTTITEQLGKVDVKVDLIDQKLGVIAHSSVHTHRGLEQIQAATAILGQFQDPHITVAGSLEAIVDAFKHLPTVEILQGEIADLKAENRHLRQEMGEVKGMLAHLIAALRAPAQRHHHDDGHGCESGSD